MPLFQRLRTAVGKDTVPPGHKLPPLKGKLVSPSLPLQPNVLQPPQRNDTNTATTASKIPWAEFEAGWFAVGFMVLSTGLMLFTRTLYAFPRAILLHKAGFVDWFAWRRFQHNVIWLVSPLVIDITVLAVVASMAPSNRKQFRQRCMAAVHVAAFIVVAGTAYDFWSRAVNDRVWQLSRHSEAISSYNRGFCQAWCRQGDPTLGGFARGQCGQGDTTLFDFFVSSFDVSDWCGDAIEQQSFALGAKYNGISPFARWNGVGEEELTTEKPALEIFHIVLSIVGHTGVYAAVHKLTL